jgi:hypothetical protein
VWIGEFLHPGEYSKRFPKVNEAFAVVRTKTIEGAPATRFETWNARLESAIRARDTDCLLSVLAGRPGELARRVDIALRLAGDTDAQKRVADTVLNKLGDFSTPVLLTLRAHLSKRYATGGVRAYWPKGRVATGAIEIDRRQPIPQAVICKINHAIDAELIDRFEAQSRFEETILDQELCNVLVPFNERTSSASSVALPRGSRIEVEAGKLVRLFLHWCQPPKGMTTDLDLSVAFYSDDWRYAGVCSYYELKLVRPGVGEIARSAGDLRDASWPDGATEFVDIDRQKALDAGFRYCVTVINAYAGLPFSGLERGFAGLMLRDDPGGSHFDPRTVAWRFTLQGQNGVFMPMVFDLQENLVHWLDVQAKGQFEMNNVETSRKAIAQICPQLISYFRSGARPSMWDLGLLHAAARSRKVTIQNRGRSLAHFVRMETESAAEFHRRLTQSTASLTPDSSETLGMKPNPSAPVLAVLYRGECDLPPGSIASALFRERISNPITASDLLS